jgi:hypothetical protein
MDRSIQQEQFTDTWIVLDRGALLVIVAASLVTVMLVLPFVPVGFFVLLPAIPAVAYHLFMRHEWRRELRRLMNPRGGESEE